MKTCEYETPRRVIPAYRGPWRGYKGICSSPVLRSFRHHRYYHLPSVLRASQSMKASAMPRCPMPRYCLVLSRGSGPRKRAADLAHCSSRTCLVTTTKEDANIFRLRQGGWLFMQCCPSRTTCSSIPGPSVVVLAYDPLCSHPWAVERLPDGKLLLSNVLWLIHPAEHMDKLRNYCVHSTCEGVVHPFPKYQTRLMVWFRRPTTVTSEAHHPEDCGRCEMWHVCAGGSW